MTFNIPIYVEETRPEGHDAPEFIVRPLFFDQPMRRGERLFRVLDRLAGDLRKTLHQLGGEARQDALARWTFCPDLSDHELEFSLRSKRETSSVRLLFASFKALERTLVFAPAIPELWFELRRGQSLAARAEEALVDHIRRRNKQPGEAFDPGAVSLKGKARISTMELAVSIPSAVSEERSEIFAVLGGEQTFRGSAELARVGRCLDSLYPDELDRAVLREREVAELTRLLNAADKRPILLLGPRQAGKTTLVHEVVFNAMEAGRKRHGGKRQTWLLSPQRLISGMSRVGQWEGRLLAVIEEAAKQEHILYFDDLPGLFLAGVSASSDLCVAHVLKSQLEKRSVRVLGEIAPEAWRVLRERDRRFADLFHVLPVNEPDEPRNRRILLDVQRQLEDRHRCCFDLDALPAAIELQRRHAGDLAFPGKAARFLRQLALKYHGGSIGRRQVIDEFHAGSGMAQSFLDTASRLARDDILHALQSTVVGQDAALNALADVLAVARARINDPARPLGTLLFPGPTGVGKTQSAKALARFLFGSADRLLRFDMNEFVDASAVTSLTGTFREPEGLLTSAVRNQPFAVLLFDEIEKAHPSVFDLLLSVLGEGRLTDALGRTASFTNCLIVLTSNLGVRESRSRLGFRANESEEAESYVRAAEAFFRPEFFNRLDRVVPFAPLSREHVSDIARGLIRDVLGRDGLRQRRTVLKISDPAIDRLVDQGFHPQLGARAMKRAVERQVAQPLAARLSSMAPGTPTVIHLLPHGEDISPVVQPLTSIESRELPAILRGHDLAEDFPDRIEAALRQLETRIAELEPRGSVSLDTISPGQKHYFGICEQLRMVRGMLGHLRRKARQTSAPGPGRALRPRKFKSNWTRAPLCRLDKDFKTVRDVERLQSALDDVTVEPIGDESNYHSAVLARELALLDLMVKSQPTGRRVVFGCTSTEGGVFGDLMQAYFNLFDHVWGLECTVWSKNGPITDNVEWLGLAERRLWEIFGEPEKIEDSRPRFLVVEGFHVAALAFLEQGTHLLTVADHFFPIQYNALELGPDDDPWSAWQARLKEHDSWVESVARGEASVDGDPLAFGPVVRIYKKEGLTLDLRTGLVVKGWPGGRDLRTFLLSQLPLPPQLDDD